jgi:predicted ATP-dependent protease
VTESKDPTRPVRTFSDKIAALRVDASKTTVRHDPSQLAEEPEGAGEDPDLFRLMPRAVRRAFDLGLLTADPWFHVFVEAADDVDILPSVVARARMRLADRPLPDDVAYVHDFDHPSAPRPILLPPGGAPILARTVVELLDAVRARLPQLDGDREVKATRAQLSKELKDRQKSAISELEGLAKGLGFGVKTVGGGVQTFPILHGKPVSAEQFEILDEGTKRALTEAEEKLSQAIEETADRVRASTRDLEERSRAVEEKAVRALVEAEAGPFLDRFVEIPEARAWLERVCAELVASVDDLLASQGPKTKGEREEDEARDPEIPTRLARFQVNVFVTNGLPIEEEEPPGEEPRPESLRASRGEPAPTPTTPVIHEDNPTFANLFGFLERRVHLGALVSDFTRIRAGALHRASGGVLVLRMRDLLGDALAWDRLKRVLRARGVGHEDPIGPMGLYATTLRPRPCPIATKVIIVGNHDLYAQLLEADPDFASLFRVKVEIPTHVERNADSIAALDAHLVRIANGRGWGPLDRGARARALDYACRLVDDRRKLALFLQPVEEAMAFATVIAHERAFEERRRPSTPPALIDAPPPSIPPPSKRRSLAPPPMPSERPEAMDEEEVPLPIVCARDLDEAWQERRDRTAGTERDLRDMVVTGEVLVATEGYRVGVVNGLSVLSAGDVQFGHPMRITAVVSVGAEGVVDVEREASLGGNVHTKGVAILRGFLSGMFGQERPVALRAQIAFEQSYGEVEGDSASSSELYAILSAISDVPIDQGIAVTGSVNQLGEIQAIGGVAAKVEGFFDLCAARGLTGRQGVMIPVSCVQHVILRDDVSAAIADGKFHLFAVDSVSQGIEVLSGIPAGQRDAAGRFPAESVFGRVERRLIEIAERMRRSDMGPSDLAAATEAIVEAETAG